MICERMLQYRVKQNLRKVFQDRLIILDWDTHNTGAGRPDAVFLTEHKQIAVVEFEPVLSTNNVEHALIQQAWKGAEKWYWNASQHDIPLRYRYTIQALYPNKGEPPSLHDELGLDSDDAFLWDRRKKCIVIAAAPQVDVGVLDVARKAVESYLSSAGSDMPFEVWIYEIRGHFTDEDIEIVGCNRELVGESPEKAIAPPEGSGLPFPHQHQRGELTPEFKKVRELLPKYISSELQNDAGYDLFCKADFKKVLKLMPVLWSVYGVDVCFEFSRMDSANEIKGPLCVIRIGKLPKLGAKVRQILDEQLGEIAQKLECDLDDLECQGTSWPLRQYRIWKPNPPYEMSPDDIARRLGRFCSVVYPIINPVIMSALGFNSMDDRG